jgi:hypothetical protein
MMHGWHHDMDAAAWIFMGIFWVVLLVVIAGCSRAFSVAVVPARGASDRRRFSIEDLRRVR